MLRKSSIKKLHRGRLTHSNLAGYAFIGPWLIGFFAFSIVPMVMSLYYSFTRYDILSAPVWVGLANYINIFTNDAKFLKASSVTALFVVASVPLRLTFALLVAMLFRGKRRGVAIYRAIYYIPSVIGGSVAVSIMWKQLFGRSGVLNSFLKSLGILSTAQMRNWTAMPETALWTLILLAIWQFGSPMLIFLAGLKQIPAQLYEAAAIDGARSRQQFWHITLPSLSSVIFFNLIMQTISGFMAFTQAFLITDGKPMDNTLFYNLYLYRRAFVYYEMGYASALAWVLLVIMAVMTAILFKTSNYWVFYESKGEG